MIQTVWEAPTALHGIAVAPGEVLTISIKRGDQHMLELSCGVHQGQWPAGIITAIMVSVEKPWNELERGR